MHMGVLPACVSVHHVCAVPVEARRGCHIPGTGVTDSCELLCGCWELNLGPLEEQRVLLTRVIFPVPWSFIFNCGKKHIV